MGKRRSHPKLSLVPSDADIMPDKGAAPAVAEAVAEPAKHRIVPTPDEVEEAKAERCLPTETYGVTEHNRENGYWVEVRETGMFRCTWKKNKETGESELDEAKVAGVISVFAATEPRDDGGEAGLVLIWRTKGGAWRRRVVPTSFAFEAANALSRWCSAVELWFEPKEVGTLQAYLAQANPANRIACYSRTGWHDGVFVVHDRVIGEADAVFQPRDPNAGAATSKRGTLAEWHDRVALPACELPWWRFAMAASFAAPLVKLLGEASQFFHAVGQSSSGKTIGGYVAASVWGRGTRNDPASYVQTWNQTGNALEAAAAAHCDLPLILDELGEADARSVKRTVYQLSHGVGRGRMTSDATIRRRSHWQGLFISTGEVGLASKVGEAREVTSAGMMVRFLELPVEAGGLVWRLDDDDRASRLAAACGVVYGSAGPAFVEWLIARGYGDTEAEACIQARQRLAAIEAALSAGCDARERRAARGFALVQLAGELATEAGVLPGEADTTATARRVFDAWRSGSRSSGATDDMLRIARKLLNFILAERGTSIVSSGTDLRRSRTGYDSGGDRVYLLPAEFEDLLGGLPTRDFCNAAIRSGALIGEGRSFKIKVPPKYDSSRPRVYQIDLAALQEWVDPASEA